MEHVATLSALDGSTACTIAMNAIRYPSELPLTADRLLRVQVVT